MTYCLKLSKNVETKEKLLSAFSRKLPKNLRKCCFIANFGLLGIRCSTDAIGEVCACIKEYRDVRQKKTLPSHVIKMNGEECIFFHRQVAFLCTPPSMRQFS